MPRYPRDFRGYGANPPDAAWPDGAKIAVSVVLNYEEGGENNILHGDAASEAFRRAQAEGRPFREVYKDVGAEVFATAGSPGAEIDHHAIPARRGTGDGGHGRTG